MNSFTCVDASLVIRTLVPGHLSDQAAALLEAWQRERTTLIAPTLLAFEVTSVLRRLVFLGEIATSEGEKAFQQFLRMEIRLSSQRSVFPLAWKLAQDLRRPRAYDTAYLALAQLRGCDFWTADERLYNAVRRRLDWVKWIGGFEGRWESA